VEAQEERLLPVPDFHVVFTLPEGLRKLALQNKRELYGLLLRCSARTLQRVASDPRHLGADIGFVSVLHIWSQTLFHHPHVHCLVPGGGLSRDSSRWIACRQGFFLPVRVLGRVFRGKFLAGVEELHRRWRLVFQGALSGLSDGAALAAYLAGLRRKDWVVYAKPPFGGPERVLRYLARYTHRVAISNSRLLALDDGQVTFRYRDRRGGDRQRTMRLPAVEFLRRFLLHLLPKGFPKIRNCGILANRSGKLERCRQILERPMPEANQESESPTEVPAHSDEALPTCPRCGSTRLIRREIPATGPRAPTPVAINSS